MRVNSEIGVKVQMDARLEVRHGCLSGLKIHLLARPQGQADGDELEHQRGIIRVPSLVEEVEALHFPVFTTSSSFRRRAVRSDEPNGAKRVPLGRFKR